MNDQVTAMMERARARASELAGAANVPAVSAPAATPSGKSFGLDDFGGGFSCDVYIKPQLHGLAIGNDMTTIFDEIVVKIDMTEVQVTEAIKAGQPPRYWKTTDGVKSTRGGSWEEAVAQAQQLDPKAYTYPSADVPMRSVIDLVSKTGQVLADSTKVLGYSIPTTGASYFATLIKAAEKGGMKNGVVLVKLTSVPTQKGNYKPYPLVKFEYLGPAEDGELEAAA